MVNLGVRTFPKRLYCLKPRKQINQAVDQAQQEAPREIDDSDKKGALRCRECKYPITRNADRTAVNEKHHHVFANPHGYVYQIGCFTQAPGCVIIGQETDHFSWFAGYSWRIALCGKCLTLLGWTFRKGDAIFFGLILESLMDGA